MGRPIGGVFLHAAHGPVAFAASCVAQNQILKGLEELAIEGLRGGFDRGVADVARLAGVPLREVMSLLPTQDLEERERRLAVSQPAAVEAWRMHAGAFGFLDVITQLTVDGRPVDIGAALERLAAKVRADEGLAMPLLQLAEDIAAWEALVFQSRAVLDDGEALTRAFRLRQQRRFATAIAAALVILSAVSIITFTAVARGRVDDALASSDPCLALTLGERDRSLASSEQDRAIAAAERRCTDGRLAEQEARAREERERRDREEAERTAAERRKRCTSFAESLQGASPTLPSGDRFAARLADRRLDSSDLGPAEPKMECWREPGLPASVDAAIDRAFVEAVLAFPGGWVHVIDPSPRTADLLAARAEEIAPWQRSLLAARAAREADRALLGGNPDDAARARRTCALAERLGVTGGASCTGLQQLREP